MKITAAFLGIVSILVVSCGDKKTDQNSELSTANMELKIEKLNDILKKYEEPSQLFNVSSTKAQEVTGKKGTIIFVNPVDLITEDGRPLGNSINVELKELMDQKQLLNTNAQTVSNGKLLISGGAYFIKLTSGGQQLKLKEGKTMRVEFPKITDRTMSLFYGQRDSLGAMNWEQDTEVLKQKPNTSARDSIGEKTTKISEMDELLQYLGGDSLSEPLTKEQKTKNDRTIRAYEKLYSAIEIKSFGWINCDRFWEVPNKTNLTVELNPSDSINFANVYLVFKDINSIMSANCYSYKGKMNNDRFENIPLGYKVRLVACSIKKDKVVSYASDMIINNNQTITLSMKETSDNELKKLLNAK